MCVLLAGCVEVTRPAPKFATAAPRPIFSGLNTTEYDIATETDAKNIAVILPMTGANATPGVASAIEMAFLKRKYDNISVTFYDLGQNKRDIILGAVSQNPDIVIGPVFADDVKIMRDIKPKMPTIVFSSDVSTLGDNLTTVGLIATQTVESIIHQGFMPS